MTDKGLKQYLCVYEQKKVAEKNRTTTVVIPRGELNGIFKFLSLYPFLYFPNI